MTTSEYGDPPPNAEQVKVMLLTYYPPDVQEDPEGEPLPVDFLPAHIFFTDYDTVDLCGRDFLVVRAPDSQVWIPMDEVRSFAIKNENVWYVPVSHDPDPEKYPITAYGPQNWT